MLTRHWASALLASAVLVLAGCGDGDDTSDSSSDSGDSADSGDVPAVTDTGALDDIGVTGEFGDKPTIEVPGGDPSDQLEVRVLEEGDGAQVGADDFVVADYLGQTWEQRDGEDYIFDNSYDRGTVAGFSLNGVVQGWKDGLTGQSVGSRVLLSIPPEAGYGAQSDHDLAEDTLLFVVDIVDAVAPDVAADGAPVSDLPEGMPQVEGSESGAPTLDFAGATEPEETEATVVLRGDGPTLESSVLVQMMEAPYPDGEGTQSTWELNGPQQVPLEGLSTLPGWEDIVDHLTVGSRVVTTISAEDAGAAVEGDEPGAVLLLVDVVGTY